MGCPDESTPITDRSLKSMSGTWHLHIRDYLIRDTEESAVTAHSDLPPAHPDAIIKTHGLTHSRNHRRTTCKTNNIGGSENLFKTFTGLEESNRDHYEFFLKPN